MFYFSLDDPLISTNSIDFKSCKSNPNVILCHTEHGSHLSTFSTLFSKEQWMIELGLKFIDTILKRDLMGLMVHEELQYKQYSPFLSDDLKQEGSARKLNEENNQSAETASSLSFRIC